MLTKSEYLIKKINKILEELYFPVAMNLREMSQSEMHQFRCMPFPDGDYPCIGSFLNITWIVILDYTGITIMSIINPEKKYLLPSRRKSSVELATAYKVLLDTLVTFTNENQLYDKNFLTINGFKAIKPNDY